MATRLHFFGRPRHPALIALTIAALASAQGQSPQSKPASEATKRANAALAAQLDFNDKQDFEDAQRGLIARPDQLTIKNEKGDVIWDLEPYKSYIADDKAAPDSVNPSLWRNAQLCMKYGLYKVTDRIYQVRGFDLANVSFVRGDTGWIVLDAGPALETTKAAYELVTQHLGKRPVLGVVYSHSHGDHYGGVRALVDEADVKAGKVQILAPANFTEHAISEFVIAGNAMGRRGIYMYGPLLPRNPQGGVNAGLGQTISHGNYGLILPTREIKLTGEEVTIDGVTMVFQMTPGTEAPAEMNTFLPQLRAMWMAENTTNTMHNILTLRGAQVRDALNWSKYINETIDLYGDKIDVKFQAHHWPMWDQQRIVDYWKKQRDLYKYIHDQSVSLMNRGYTGVEIANLIKLPPELARAWPNRGYYGSLKHNSRAVYQRYMGFYDGNPTTLDQLPPEEAAKKYVEYMGGAEAILKRAKGDFEKGEYRWVAEALKQIVFADAGNKEAKELLADAYEQLGYQAESGSWRSVYLQGALELRRGVPTEGSINTAGPDTVRAMPPEMTFDYLAVRLNTEKAAGKKLSVTVDFSDLKQAYALFVENSVLNYTKKAVETDVKLTLSKLTFDRVQMGEMSLEQAIVSGDLKVDGRKEALSDFLALFEAPPFWFNIVTP